MTQPTIELKPSASPLSAAEREAILVNPGFGRHFTDHMVTIKWTEGRGWHDGQLVPYGPLSLDPANMTLHYAQEIFEGLKAYQPARRLCRDVPSRQERQALPGLRPCGSACPSCPWRPSSRPVTRSSARTATGFPRTVARSPSTCVPS